LQPGGAGRGQRPLPPPHALVGGQDGDVVAVGGLAPGQGVGGGGGASLLVRQARDDVQDSHRPPAALAGAGSARIRIRVTPTPATSDRPRVALLCNTLTPYRLHLHRRLAREVPEVEFWSLFTHVDSSSPWSV